MESPPTEPPEEDGYRQQLESVCEQLRVIAESTSIIGSGIGRFAHAAKGMRSINISWGSQGILVELWDGKENIRDELESSYETAVQAAQRWMDGVSA